eukprot:TRINITY_DN13623_c0_g1_i2.p1 TRINITY_DN13623_c0_g1~~TRINITY_DN13623_c0_g1_i2.p1  ORF type:complete len:510 (+),score=113.05 TRINITY_DN13623_c0_g1_i2:113-1642(+)
MELKNTDTYQKLTEVRDADAGAVVDAAAFALSKSAGGLEAASTPRSRSKLWRVMVAQVDKPHFRTVIGTVTTLNLLCNGLEIEGKWRYWPLIEGLFVLFYISEMCLKYARYGITLQPEDARTNVEDEDAGACSSFLPSAEVVLNFFDLLFIVSGISEVTCVLLGWTDHVLYFQFFRLLRAVRIFRQFDVLTRFVECLVTLAPNLAWIFGVIVLIGYVFAVAITIYVHSSDEEELLDARVYFPSVGAAMFSLFQVTTMDGWAEIASPLIRYNPYWIPIFVSFIAFSSWTMISLLTAVVSDNMIAATQLRKEDEKAQEEQQRLKFISFLRESFAEADDDGNGMLDEDEFNTMIENNAVLQKMDALGVKLPKEDLKRTFSMLDVDGSGELSIEEFITGLTQLQQNLQTAHVVSIDYKLKRVQYTLLERMAVLQAMLSTNSHNLEAMSKSVNLLGSSIDALRQDFQSVSFMGGQAAGSNSGSSGRASRRLSTPEHIARAIFGKDKTNGESASE